MDTSGSMNDKEGSTGTKISNAIASANNFVTLVSGFVNNRIGLVSFADNGILKSPLTSNFSTVTSQVNSLSANGGTCIQCGIDKANQEISANKRTNVKNAVILLTDGLANRIESNGISKEVNPPVAEKAALVAALSGHVANGTVFYTIGLGNDVDSDFLNQLATSTGGQYYYSPTTDQLNDI
jgi:Mg-chelatase subunit ChlD